MYYDNYYTGPDLFMHLHKEKIYACGTCRKNRHGFPQDIAVAKSDEKDMNGGTIIWRTVDLLLAVMWFDRRPVYVLSTFSTPLELLTAWKGRTSLGSELQCPAQRL